MGNYFDENVGMIFNGDICFIVIGKDNVIDSWIMLQCIDSWEGYLNVSVKIIVVVGWKYSDFFSLGMKLFGFYGIELGVVFDMFEMVFFCGWVVYQSIVRLMNYIVGQCNVYWWYENNQVNIVLEDNYIGVVMVLNVNIGLIGMFQ